MEYRQGSVSPNPPASAFLPCRFYSRGGKRIDTLKILNNLIRAGFLAMSLWVIIALFVSGSTVWPFEWHLLISDLGGILLLTFFLPLIMKKKPIEGSFLRAPFFPLNGSIPVWFFWLGLNSLLFHAACALRSIIVFHTVDSHLVLSIMTGVWLWLIEKRFIWRFTVSQARTSEAAVVSDGGERSERREG